MSLPFKNYIYTACTDSSITGACLSTNEVIVGQFTATSEFVGCMYTDGTFDNFIPDTLNDVSAGFTGCTECNDIDNGTNLPVSGQNNQWIAISSVSAPGVIIYAVEVNSFGIISNVILCP